MAYTVNKTSGAVLTTIADGTIDNTSDLTLIGKNYSGYGEIFNENLVKLMENFASTSIPTSPLAGQLWWDSSNGLLKVYNGTNMKVISGSTASASAPTAVTTGDLWWDTTNSQLKVYNGTTFITIGPSFTAGTGTSGAIVDSITDNLGSSHVVVKLFVNESIVGMVSKDSSFTPQSAVSGFATINPGIQLSTSVSGSTFKGDATNAQLLDSLDSSQFLRSDAADTTSGTLGVLNDTGLTVGADGDIVLSAPSASPPVVATTPTRAGVLNMPGADWELGLEAEAMDLLLSGRTDVWDALTRRFESKLIMAALANTRGRRIEAAVKLGIGRNTITRKIQELGLDD